MSATAEVAAFLAAHEECFSNAYIGGRFVRAGGGATFSTISPTSERTIAEVPAGSRRDIEAAVAAARSAFDGSSWGTQPGCERAVCLRALAALVLAHKDILAKIESLDMGKHVDDAASDVDACCGILEEHAALAEGLDARQTVAVEGSELNRGYVRYEPYGVVAAITPWNYPLVCVVVKLAPALAAGNTLVVKPSEYTPLTSMFLCQLVHDAGFPPGVFNSVTGSGTAAGAPLAASPLIDMVSFTGSIRTGTAIMAAAARTVTKPLLELGGKSAAVIFEDIDVDEVTPWLMQGFCQNAGQVCVCHTRAIVHESVKDKLVAKLAAEVAAIPFALDPHAPPRGGPHSAMGPLVSAQQHRRVTAYIEGAKADPHCTLVTGGGRPAAAQGQPGYFVEPTIFEITGDDANATAIWREEVFGPVLAVRTFRTEEEAVRLANDTQYGLADGVFSKDVSRAERVAHQLRAGLLYVNQCMTGVNGPGGGWKMSGIGREGGEAGLMEYMQSKKVSINNGANRPSGYARVSGAVTAQPEAAVAPAAKL